MVLPLQTDGGPGGLLIMEYRNVSAGERHALRVYVTPFGPLPVGPYDDYLYTGSGPVVPGEGGILQTFAGLGMWWAPYYPATWRLHLIGLCINQDGVLMPVTPVPTVDPILGTLYPAPPPSPVFKRIFRLRSPQDAVHRLFLSQVAGEQVDVGRPVSPSGGGLDIRDVDFVTYLTGSRSAVVSRSGQKYNPQAQVLSWWSRPLEPPPAGVGGGPGDPSGDQFVQNDPPSDPQDGWLWVDTRVGPPYQAYIWEDALPGWRLVGSRVGNAPQVQANFHGSFDHGQGALWVNTNGEPPYPLYVMTAPGNAEISRSAWTASATHSLPGAPPASAFDGDPGSRWISGHNQVSGNTFTVDMGSLHLLASIKLDSGYSSGQGAQQYSAEVSVDGVTWVTVVTDYETFDDDWISVPPDLYRYFRFRLTTDESRWWGISDVRAYNAHVAWQQIGGLIGPTGERGETGEIGATGERGETGPVGPPGPSGFLDDAGTLGGDCLHFPRGATICNDEDGIIHITTPTGAFALDATGITLPGGARVEVVDLP